MNSVAWQSEEIYHIAERAFRLYGQSRLREAAVLFEGLIALVPDDAYCRRGLAAIAIRRGDYRLAVEHLTLALALNPLDCDLLSCRCEAYILSADLASAERDLKTLRNRGGAAAHDVSRLELQLRIASEPPLARNPRQLLSRRAR